MEKPILTKQEFLKLVKKRDDKLAMIYYKQGESDQKIAEHFGMNRSSIYAWRMKNGLIANNPRFSGEKNLSEEELKKSHKKFIKYQVIFEAKRRKANPVKYREYQKRCSHLPRNRKRIIEYNKKSNATPKRKEYKREWTKNWKSIPENKEKYNSNQMEWRKKNRMRLLKYNNDRYKMRKNLVYYYGSRTTEEDYKNSWIEYEGVN